MHRYWREGDPVMLAEYAIVLLMTKLLVVLETMVLEL